MNKIDPNILVAVIAGSVTILGYFIARYFEKKKVIEQQIREQKLPAYEEFVDFLFDIFKKTKDGRKFNDKDIKELGEFYWEMNKKAILWLSDKTLKSYSTWKSMTSDYADKENRSEVENLNILFALETLLLDFRNDIGHDNKNIEKGDILKIFINNFDDYNKRINNGH
jgi:hypothetical protein